MTEPSNSEIVRRIEEMGRSVDRLTSNLETGYVRKDVYESDQRGQRHRVGEIEKDLETSANFRRSMIVALSGVAITVVVSLAIAIANLIARTS